jgi:hypothetical protein
VKALPSKSGSLFWPKNSKLFLCTEVAIFRIYDIDNDGYISNGELFQVLKMMVGNNLKDTQLQQIVDKTILIADKVTKGASLCVGYCRLVNFLPS